MKCLNCKSKVAGFGRCYMCGAMIKKVKEMSVDNSNSKKQRVDYSLISYIFSVALCVVLIALLIYQAS